MGESETFPLFRTALAGPEAGIRRSFDAIRSGAWQGTSIVDAERRLLGARVPVSQDPSEGYWDLCATGRLEAPELFTVVTRANYASVREEAVLPEGLFEIHLLIEGPAAVETEAPDSSERDRRFDQPTLILCQAGISAGYSVFCPPGPRELVSLYVEPEALAAMFGLSVPTLSPLARQLLSPEPGDTASIIATPARLPLLAAVRSLGEDRPFSYHRLQLIRAKSLEILCHVVDELNAIETAPLAMTLSASDIDMLERARAILQNAIDAPPTIAALARSVGTNTDKLKRGFKLMFGMTVFEYSLQCRMGHAQQLLTDGLPVKSVAAAVGYRHQASFATAFRNFFGYSPTYAVKGAKEAGVSTSEAG